MALSWTKWRLAALGGAACLALASVCEVGLAQGQRFSVDNRLNTRLVYTDNRRLDENGESDIVLSLRPGVSIQRRGARVRLDLDYELGFAQSLSADSGARLSNFLNAEFASELYENTWFLDAQAGANLVSTSGLSTLESDGIYDDDNSTQAYSFTVSPHSRHHFGQYVDLFSRTTFDLVGAEEGSVSDSGGAAFMAGLQSGSYFSRLPWSITFEHETIDREERSDDRSSLVGRLNYLHDRQWRFFSTLGIESNDVQSARADTDGMTWSLGGGWTPNPRTRLGVSYGERYFGNTWNFDLSHRTRRTLLTAGLSRSISNVRRVIQEALFATLTLDGQPVVDDTGEPIVFPFLVPRLIDEDFVQERLRLGAVITGRRSTLSLQTSWSSRSYEISATDEDAFDVSARFSRSLSGRTRGSARVSWQQLDQASGTDRSTYLVALNLAHRLGRYSSVSLDISHRRQDDVNGNAFDENRVTAGFTTQIW